MSAENVIRGNSEPTLGSKESSLFSACGIDPAEVYPKVLGRGGNHKVYLFKDGERVVKVPINPHIGTVGSAAEESNNIALYLQYFPDFSVPTTFIDSPLGYCVVMDFVDGRLLTRDDVFETEGPGKGQLTPTGEQLGKILTANRRLMADTGKMLDLVGLEGFFDAITRLRPKSQPAQLTNVRIEDERLRIVDYDLVELQDLRGPLDIAQAVFAYQLNQQVLSHHFKMSYS